MFATTSAKQDANVIQAKEYLTSGYVREEYELHTNQNPFPESLIKAIIQWTPDINVSRFDICHKDFQYIIKNDGKQIKRDILDYNLTDEQLEQHMHYDDDSDSDFDLISPFQSRNLIIGSNSWFIGSCHLSIVQCTSFQTLSSENLD